MINKPNFFIVGAPKCGTTSMFVTLKNHPDIFMPSYNANGIKVKEPRFLIKDPAGQQRVRMGLLNASSQYGISGSDGDGNLLFKLGQAGNEIAGWEIAQGILKYDASGGSIAMDATNQQISIHTGSINTARPKVVMGKLPRVGGSFSDDRYGFAVFSGSANADINVDTTYSVLITKDEARLAGWDMSPGKLTSGTVARIDGNTATIALGTNASTHTSTTPQPSLFFVSASEDPIFFVGENFSYETAAKDNNDGGPPSGGEFILAISPEKIAGTNWGKHSDEFFKKMQSMDGVRLPGERRHKNRLDLGPRKINKELIEKIKDLS